MDLRVDCHAGRRILHRLLQHRGGVGWTSQPVLLSLMLIPSHLEVRQVCQVRQLAVVEVLGVVGTPTGVERVQGSVADISSPGCDVGKLLLLLQERTNGR